MVAGTGAAVLVSSSATILLLSYLDSDYYYSCSCALPLL